MQRKIELFPWDLTIIDANPPAFRLASLTAGDIDGDGQVEVIVGGAGPRELTKKHEGGLIWYRPATFERGVIAKWGFQVGLTAADIDGDGRLEIIAGENLDDKDARRLFLYHQGRTIRDPWSRSIVDPSMTGAAHDIIVVDIDGDGELEIVSNAVYTDVTPAVYVYKRESDFRAPWKRSVVQRGYSEEGLACADLNGDGRTEIVSGTSWYASPGDDDPQTPWIRRPISDDFREYCRAEIVDLNNDGVPEVILVESEYPDGRLSWFENRVRADSEAPWVEHVIERNVRFGHSLRAWKNDGDPTARLFVGEMQTGGFGESTNYDARLLLYSFGNKGDIESRELIYQGQGTHEATACDVDGDGEMEIVGKGFEFPTVLMWKRPSAVTPFSRIRHSFIDRNKPYGSTDIFVADIDGDGIEEVVTGAWWYRSTDWTRHEIPGIYQAILAEDIDGDGRAEIIATKRRPDATNWYDGLSSILCWLKPIAPSRGEWQEFPIGSGQGDWPHGFVIASVLPGGRRALVVTYHAGRKPGQAPEIFEIPEDPRSGEWPRRRFSYVGFSEQIVAADVDHDGLVDLIGGGFWFRNLGDGTFDEVSMMGDFRPSRICLLDVNRDGKEDVVASAEVLDFDRKVTPISNLQWFERPSDPKMPWIPHVIDRVRCAHSLSVGDVDGDGDQEIVVGEHDPFRPYRSRSRLLVYKRRDSDGSTWRRYCLDSRFEHHDGAKLIRLENGTAGILSIGWKEPEYVHIWK